jgi:hypothetical protein
MGSLSGIGFLSWRGTAPVIRVFYNGGPMQTIGDES